MHDLFGPGLRAELPDKILSLLMVHDAYEQVFMRIMQGLKRLDVRGRELELKDLKLAQLQLKDIFHPALKLLLLSWQRLDREALQGWEGVAILKEELPELRHVVSKDEVSQGIKARLKRLILKR